MDYVDEILDHQNNYDKTAIIQGNRQITYGQLKEISYYLANQLLGLSTNTGEKVMILLEKSIEYVVSYFGVMKSGKCFIPIDATLPGERLQYMIDNSKSTIVITNKKLYNSFSAQLKGMSIIYLENFEEYLEVCQGCNETSIVLDRTTKDLAYIIYTSGSTGNPKGVKIRNDSFTAFLLSMTSAMPYYHETCRYLSVFPYHFDASWVDIFPTLYVGGQLIIFERLMSANQLLKTMEQYKITMTCIPSTIVKLIAGKFVSIEKFDLSNLELIWYGTESCPTKHIKYLHSKLPNVKFIHSYGPTEATCTSHIYYCEEKDFETEQDLFPIGKELNTITSYALNDQNQLIIEGEVGELYISGVQVMDGYCGDEEKTKEVLVENYFNSNEIAYKTGDYVTVDKEGNYIFTNRRDDMVKVYGKLVYLSEIEKALNGDKRIKDSIVTSYKDEMEMIKIRACIIKDSMTKLEVQEVKEMLQNKLPKYMIPAKFIIMNEEDVPKTSSMKVDRKKLIWN